MTRVAGVLIASLVAGAAPLVAQAPPAKADVVMVAGCLKEQPAGAWQVVNALDPKPSNANAPPIDRNPDPAFDWYTIGGRWDGVFAGLFAGKNAEVDGIGGRVEGNICAVAALPGDLQPGAVATPDGRWHSFAAQEAIASMRKILESHRDDEAVAALRKILGPRIDVEAVPSLREILAPYGSYYVVAVDAHA